MWQTLEILSTITGIICVFLQTRERILAWPFGIVSVFIASFIFYENKLYSDLILHGIYFFLNIYGWWYWSQYLSQDRQVTPIVNWPLRSSLILIPILVIATFLWGWAMRLLTDADLPYFDAFTTTGSLAAQYLLARKILQNWILWIVVDIVAIQVYLYKGLYYFSFLFLVYLLLCIWGYIQWKSNWQKTNS